jgi:phospholipid/cholesterol/gamma-HCH transport system substrate-binding protein
VLPTPTAILLLDTQRFLSTPNKELPGFANAQWADSIPKMLQVKLIQSFENYDVAHAPLRAADNPGTTFQLLIDLRSFQINTDPEPTAEIGFSARILNKDGQVVASHLFQQRKKLDKLDPASAVAAFDGAFGSIATELITWTAGAL